MFICFDLNARSKIYTNENITNILYNNGDKNIYNNIAFLVVDIYLF